MSLIGTGARYYTLKWSVKGVCHRHDEPNKSCSTSGCQQRQQKPHSHQRVDYIKNVIDNFIDGLRSKLTGNLINSVRFTWRTGFSGTLCDLSLYVAFNL